MKPTQTLRLFSQTEQDNPTSVNNNGVMKSDEEKQEQHSCFENHWAASENDSADESVKRESEHFLNVDKSKFCSVFNQYIITDGEGQVKCSFCGHVSSATSKSQQRYTGATLVCACFQHAS